MELEQCVNFVLTKAQNAVQQLFKAELAPYGVTPGQYAVLKCLWDEMANCQAAIRTALSGRIHCDRYTGPDGKQVPDQPPARSQGSQGCTGYVDRTGPGPERTGQCRYRTGQQEGSGETGTPGVGLS